MELQGRVIHAGDVRSGQSARGDWKAQDFVIETHESYPHKMVFSVFGEDRLSRFNIQVGQEIKVSFDIDAREYNGRWFNSIRAYDVQLATDMQVAAPAAVPSAIGAPAPAAPAASADEAPFAAPAPAPEGESSDDLPF